MVFSDVHKAVMELFRARSERPFTSLEVHGYCYCKGGQWKEGEGEREGTYLAINHPANIPVLGSQ